MLEYNGDSMNDKYYLDMREKRLLGYALMFLKANLDSDNDDLCKELGLNDLDSLEKEIADLQFYFEN